MNGERVAALAAAGFIGLKCAVVAANLAVFPVLRPVAREAVPAGRVSLLVPARDEEDNLARSLPGLLAQPADEILVLDDGSRDATAEVVRKAADTDPRVRLLTGQPLPDGWMGKAWACHQLGREASGDVLVFCDADVRLVPGALSAVLAEAERQRADVFSVFPRQRTGTPGERLLVPLIDDVLLSFLPHRLLDAPVPLAATANGQLLCFRRAAYDLLGGHASVRSAVVEDVRFAVRTRQAGLKLGLALGGDLVGARMYEGFDAAVDGFAKNVLAAHGGSRPLLAASAAWHLLAYTAPWLRMRAHGAGRSRRAWAVAAGLALAERVAVNAKTGRGDYWEAALMPVTPLAALPVCVRAMRRTRVWKGRRFS